MFSRTPSSATQNLCLHGLLLGSPWNVFNHCALSLVTESLWSPADNILVFSLTSSFPVEWEQIYIPSTTLTFLGSNFFPLSVLPRFLRPGFETQKADVCRVSLAGRCCSSLACWLQDAVEFGEDPARQKQKHRHCVTAGGLCVLWWDLLLEHA